MPGSMATRGTRAYIPGYTLPPACPGGGIYHINLFPACPGGDIYHIKPPPSMPERCLFHRYSSLPSMPERCLFNRIPPSSSRRLGGLFLHDSLSYVHRRGHAGVCTPTTRVTGRHTGLYTTYKRGNREGIYTRCTSGGS